MKRIILTLTLLLTASFANAQLNTFNRTPDLFGFDGISDVLHTPTSTWVLGWNAYVVDGYTTYSIGLYEVQNNFIVKFMAVGGTGGDFPMYLTAFRDTVAFTTRGRVDDTFADGTVEILRPI